MIREVDQNNVSTYYKLSYAMCFHFPTIEWKLYFQTSYIFWWCCYVHVLPFQDGQIDYNEFVAMMQRGNADLGNSGLKCSSSFNIGLRKTEALSVY
jgi:hypothetical protein